MPSRLPGALVLDELWPALPGSDRRHETLIKAASIPRQLRWQAALGYAVAAAALCQDLAISHPHTPTPE